MHTSLLLHRPGKNIVEDHLYWSLIFDLFSQLRPKHGHQLAKNFWPGRKFRARRREQFPRSSRASESKSGFILVNRAGMVDRRVLPNLERPELREAVLYVIKR
jgi:hypothetical protein